MAVVSKCLTALGAIRLEIVAQTRIWIKTGFYFHGCSPSELASQIDAEVDYVLLEGLTSGSSQGVKAIGMQFTFKEVDLSPIALSPESP